MPVMENAVVMVLPGVGKLVQATHFISGIDL